MNHLSATQLLPLEKYVKVRPEVREKMIDYKNHRQVQLGEHARICFEDRTTIQYQIQEMLRVEKIFEEQAIEEELEAYNPLIPDGSNWKATFMLEYPDVEERKQALAQLVGIEHLIWVKVADLAKVFAIANEDMPRSTAEKTSSVHFLRFELSPEMVAACHKGADVFIGIDHQNYPVPPTSVPKPILTSLVADLALDKGDVIFSSFV